MDPTQRISCPLCEKIVGSDVLHTFTPEQSAAHFCPESKDKDRHHRLSNVIQSIWKGKKGRIYVCEHCGFGFGYPHIGGNDAFYQILHENSSYPTWRWEYGETINAAKQDFPTGGAVLDIGAGDGTFLRLLGKSWKKYATEGSDTTREKLRCLGIDCFTSMDEALDQYAGQFDLVTIFQALEHIASFKTVLEQCTKLLKPRGMLVVSVPNGDVLYEQEKLTGLPDMIPGHINKFTPANLRFAFEQSGLVRIEHSAEPSHFKRAVYCATLATRAQASKNPASFAGKAWGIKHHKLRLAALAFVSGLNLLTRTSKLQYMMRGGALAVVGRKQAS